MILRDPLRGWSTLVACLVFCLPMVGAAGTTADAEKRMRQLSAEEVAQVWVGLSGDELYLLRLRLDVSGRGTAAYAFADQPPRRFTIQSWTYQNGQISIALERADDSSLPIPTLNGAVVGTAMKLTMSGEGWSRKVELRFEEALESRWRRLKEAMDARE
jgi:hypothetical protein